MKRCFITFIFVLVAGLSVVTGQNLTVRDIMAEPSIAGMRAEGEKLSPDGTKAVFLWNAEGKMPRDIYLVSTTGGEPAKILSVSELPVPSRTPDKETKLDYGLELRDEFVRARENQVGGVEWSPDSKKILLIHAGDIYVMKVGAPVSQEDKNATWSALETAIRRRSLLLREFVKTFEDSMIDAEFIPWLKKHQKDLEVSLQSGGAWDSQRQISLQIDRRLGDGLERFLLSGSRNLSTSNDDFTKLLDELSGVQNRINVARLDYEARLQSNKPKRYTKTQSLESAARFLDNDRILFQQSGNLYVLNTVDATLVQLSREANPQNFISISNINATKDGKLVAYVVSDSSKQRALVVPNYLGEFVQPSNVRRGWTEQKVMVMPTDGSRDTPFEIKLPKPEGVSSIRRIVWAADNSSLLIDRIDKDTKRRTLVYVHDVGSKGEKIIPIIEETDDKWQATLSSIFEPNPKDSSELFFGSERDGFNHLYLAKLEQAETRAVASVLDKDESVATANGPVPNGKVTIKQLTKGNWQVEWAKWTDGKGIVFTSTENQPSTTASYPGYAERELYIYRTDQNRIIPLDLGSGMKTGYQISETAEVPVLLYERSAWNQPGELYAHRLALNEPRAHLTARVTSTVPRAFERIKWSEPKFIEIPSRDGKKIPAKIYLPAKFSARSRQKYPMVIFVHGAGYLQNVINGWNNYYREFMFNDLLTRRGYVVLDIDYRGSAGYGREWRTDVHNFLGGKDYDDHIDAIDHMIANYAVDPAKIGVYGGSYGGFMAGMLVMRAPEKIAAAAALRPVFDWKNYYAANPGYTAQRLGFPDKNPEAYRRSSPISYADKLQRPLLILHGMSDDNVHVQDSVQLMEKLIRLGKSQYVEAMLYPSENHVFVRPESWADEYERILAFFEKHLK